MTSQKANKLSIQIVQSEGLYHVYIKPKSNSDVEFQLLLGVYKTSKDAGQAVKYINLSQYKSL